MKTSQPDPGRRLHALPIAQTTIDDAFWSAKLALFRSTTIDDVFGKFEQTGALANFDRVAQGQTGGHVGAPWFDGLIFETIRGASDFLATQYDRQLDARLDGYIARIAAAQAADADGYLNTFVTLTCPEQRWGAQGGNQLWSHEEYNAGCLVEAGVHHYRATGKTSLLSLGLRFANYLCDYMGPTPKHNVVPSHALPEEALLKLHQLLQADPALAAQLPLHAMPNAYLELARFWIDNRGRHQGRVGFTEYAQDHKPIVEQEAAVGHAVRATLLYTGLTALAGEVGSPAYRQAAARLWRDVTERKLYLTGGVGSINQYEGFSFSYYLPSDGYNETCAAVGLAFWAGRMNEVFGGAEYADIVERVIYNGALAGVSLAGTEYSYENPLSSHGSAHRWHWHGCPCCPPMFLKLYSSLGEHIYAQADGAIFVNQYISGNAKIALKSGKDSNDVQLTLQSEFPWNGLASATLHMDHPLSFDLGFRVPSWCPELRVRVNGQPQAALDVVDGYAVVMRTWQDGDRIELEFAMPIQRMVAHPSVNQLHGRVALQRGPLVYCVEGVDDHDDPDVVLAADAQLRAEYRPDLLGGVVTLVGRTREGGEVRAIPYYTWDNRQATDKAQDWMAVWIKQAESVALRRALEGDERSGWEHQLYRPLP